MKVTVKNDLSYPDGKMLDKLLKNAREGSQDALGELKRKYAPLISSMIAKYVMSDMSRQDVEDIREEANVIFCNSVCNYDSTSGVEFGLYAKICLDNGLISFVRSYVRRRKQFVLYSDNVKIDFGDSSNFLQSIVDEENTEDLVKRIRCHLSDYENRIWWMYVSGMSVSDIAVAVSDVDAKSVSNAIYRIRRKLKSVLR